MAGSHADNDVGSQFLLRLRIQLSAQYIAPALWNKPIGHRAGTGVERMGDSRIDRKSICFVYYE